MARSSRNYPGWKPNCNSRNISSALADDYPNVTKASITVQQSFQDACKKVSEMLGVEVKPTPRQASKFRNKQGIVYKTLNNKFSQDELDVLTKKVTVVNAAA